MYDEFSLDYDRFVNWSNRLAFEMPLIEERLKTVAARDRQTRVLDAATGTGMHVVELASRGYDAYGADLSERMIEKARANAASREVKAVFEAAGFGDLRRAFFKNSGEPLFDAVLCFGNSIVHLLNPAAIQKALEDFAACLRPGGLVLIQIQNYDLILRQRVRWMDPQSHREGHREWLFIRHYDHRPDGLIDFTVLTLTRAGEGEWKQRAGTTPLYPLYSLEMINLLERSGFEKIACMGSMQGEPFNVEKSGNLVVQALKR